MICPLLTLCSAQHENQPMCYCLEEKCAWWVAGDKSKEGWEVEKCAILVSAEKGAK